MTQKILDTDHDVALTVLRVALGLIMFPHAAQKLFGWFGGFGFAGTVGYFQGLGIPVALGTLVILVEFVGSIALVLGVAGRLWAAGLGAVMIGAIFTVHAENGFFMNWTGAQAGEGFEFHLVFLAAATVLALRGSGAFSLDRRLSQLAG